MAYKIALSPTLFHRCASSNETIQNASGALPFRHPVTGPFSPYPTKLSAIRFNSLLSAERGNACHVCTFASLPDEPMLD